MALWDKFFSWNKLAAFGIAKFTSITKTSVLNIYWW